MTMIFEDHVECEECGSEIVHLCYGSIPTGDPDYRLCQSCINERDRQERAAEEEAEKWHAEREGQAHLPGAWG